MLGSPNISRTANGPGCLLRRAGGPEKPARTRALWREPNVDRRGGPSPVGREAPALVAPDDLAVDAAIGGGPAADTGVVRSPDVLGLRRRGSFRRPLRSPVSRLVGCLGLLGGAVVLGGCGASGPSPPSALLTSECQTVSAVLSDGPDPGADPVGYAQAQILPLRRIHPRDSTLQAAVEDLDKAYRELFDTNGSSAAKKAVARASARLDAICPGAAP